MKRRGEYTTEAMDIDYKEHYLHSHCMHWTGHIEFRECIFEPKRQYDEPKKAA